jgi:hypothetical protein
MRLSTSAFVLVLALAQSLALATAGFAQYIPPHFNDPHPPANQPAYQLPTPLSRPGIPGMPNAPHFNDPHYSKTEPSRAPTMIPPTSAPFPSISRGQLRQPSYQSSRVAREAEAARRRSHKSVSLADCYGKWDAGLKVTRGAWEQNCRRLAAEGKVKG